ncbi:MAG: sulfotransferase domain-containing protein [Anaerolineales bacterium]
MNPYYRAKHRLKVLRWKMRRAETALRWGPRVLAASPKVFGNAMPKSGSHLLSQILNGLVRVGPFVNPGFPPVNRMEDNQSLPEGEVLENLLSMRSGDIRYGYLHSEEPYFSLLAASGWATVFLFRDPRDMLVSHVFYATEMNPDHGMHRYYTEVLGSMEERLNAAIVGVKEPGYELPNVRQRYEKCLDWLNQPDVLPLRFEDLVLKQDITLNHLLDYIEQRGSQLVGLRPHAIAVLKGSIAPQKSGTYRKGQPGDWREHFSESNKELFKSVAGDLLVQLGYEQNDMW